MTQEETTAADAAMIDHMLKQAGQHLLIKELVLQTLVSQLQEVGIDIDPTPGKMKMVNRRAEELQKQLDQLNKKLAAQLADDLEEEDDEPVPKKMDPRAVSSRRHTQVSDSVVVRAGSLNTTIGSRVLVSEDDEEDQHDFSQPQTSSDAQLKLDRRNHVRQKVRPTMTDPAPIQPIEADHVPNKSSMDFDPDDEYED